MSKLNLKAIKQRIRNRREDLGLRQEDVAIKIGMQRAGYSAAERSGSTIFFTIEQLHSLFKILKTTYNFIFEGIESDTASSSELLLTIEKQKTEIKRLTEFSDTLYKFNKMLELQLEECKKSKKS